MKRLLRWLASLFAPRDAYDTSRRLCLASAFRAGSGKAITCSRRAGHAGNHTTLAGEGFVVSLGYAFCAAKRGEHACDLPLGHRSAHRVCAGSTMYEWTSS